MGRCSRARQQLDENCCLAIQTNASQTQSSVTYRSASFFFMPSNATLAFSLTAIFRSMPQLHGGNSLLSHIVGSRPHATKSLKIQPQIFKIAVSPRKLAS